MIYTGTPQTLSYVEKKRPFALQFEFLDPDEILRLSIGSLTNERVYNDAGDPQFSGVNDPRMGVMNQMYTCMTCKGNQVDCPGHFGHIELAKPVFHVGLLDYVRQILKCVCFNCSKLLAPTDKDKIEQIKKIRHPKQRFYNIQRACEAHAIKICQDGQGGGCDFRQPKLSKRGLQIIAEHQDEQYLQAQQQGGTQADSKGPILPEKVHDILKKISVEDQELMGIKNPQNMIIKRLAVAPPPVRPSISTGGVMRQEDDLTFAYQKILKHNNLLKLQMEKGANQTTINELRACLQFYVATLIDNEIPGQPSHKHKNGRPLKAIRARLKGKEGRLRGNLMGKRVDFSARSVITPDPNLQLDQLGVPDKIAQNLTIPETVTPHNIDEMRRLVNNGPNKWPGAKFIIRHDERYIDLNMLMNRSDAHLEYGYKVERHIRNGDYVLFNRQPSLHKMSIMGHQVKVLPYNTFRLNLSVTTPYNADFDGDEMNMHVPQNFESLAEVRELMNVPSQIVAPQANKPVMGIVQDSLLGIMLFTRRETFLDINIVMNLMMWLGDNNQTVLPPPTIIKPKPLWTGKQVLSMLIPNVNMIKFMDPPTKDPITGQFKRIWNSPKDNLILIRQGQLLSGFFNKQSVGSSSGGLIHIIWKECGPIATRDFLSNVQNVINNWLYQYGFTVGVQDTIAGHETMSQISKTLISYKKKVQRDIIKTQNGKLKCQPGKNMMESFEAQVNSRLNNARDQAGMLAFKDLDPANKMHNMVDAGSKGTNINISQIMGCVGQQNVEGKRIFFGFNKRTLPHFHKFDFGPESKGFVENNYLSGLNPAEFFFHAMGGREGLIDTAVKTSETGYIQRRLMKALEDVMVKYDSTVRNSSDQIIQFLYGEDGMAGEYIEDLVIDTLKYENKTLEKKCCFLPAKSTQYELIEQLGKSMDQYQVKNIINSPNVQIQLLNEYKQIINDRDELRYQILTNFEEFIHLPVNVPRLILNCKEQFHLNTNVQTSLSPIYVIDQLNQLIESLTVFPGRKYKQDNQLFYEANENSTKLMKIYLRQALCTKKIIQQERFNAPAFDWLIGEIKSRFEQALVHPGEMVGSIAAHSIGEPATQMTLNTFHFAGVSSKNVTLGVPRLKEVINVAKNIHTPLVQIYLTQKRKKKEESVMKVQGLIEHTTLGQVVDSSQIFYDPDPIKTIITEDQQLVNLYNEVPDQDQGNSPWILRFTLDHSKMINKQLEIGKIKERFYQAFGDQISIMNTDINAERLVIRIRFKDLNEDEGDDSIVTFLREVEESMMNEIPLKGFPEITKVYAKKYQEKEYDEKTQGYKVSDDNWMLETDGVALAKILPVKYVDYRRTVSNDILELLNVLGVEAVRQSLLNEFRTVLRFYGIYVNYRHLATLCDVMTHKGRLTSITRHGINRLDTGPLRKCSFEETVEILLEASVFGETDMLRGVTENIIFGQLAPFGTGCFDLVLDPSVMVEYAQTSIEEDIMEGETTPIIDEFERVNQFTPYNEATPHYRQGGTSEYIGMTPASEYGVGFSPGGMHQLSSPAYSSPQMGYNSPTFKVSSPVYQPGRMFQSPIYNAYQSPIYQPQSDGQQSPHAQSPNMMSGQVSPNYSPTSAPINSPYQHSSNLESHAPNYSPSYGAPKSIITPISSSSGFGHSPASPGYSPVANSQRDSHYIAGSQRSSNSPVYSPGMGNHLQSRTSPSYSPTAPNYNAGTVNNYSPSYSPSQPVTGTSRYQVNRSSPNYNVPNIYMPQSPCYNPNRSNREGQINSNMYIPQSPMYNPVSPAYIVSGSGSVISDQEDQNDQENDEPNYNPTLLEAKVETKDEADGFDTDK